MEQLALTGAEAGVAEVTGEGVFVGEEGGQGCRALAYAAAFGAA